MSSVDQPTGLYEVLEPHLAAARLAPYLVATQGNRRQAIKLYQWNIALSGAVYEALHIVEVVLRNAINPAVERWFTSNQRITRVLRSRP